MRTCRPFVSREHFKVFLLRHYVCNNIAWTIELGNSWLYSETSIGEYHSTCAAAVASGNFERLIMGHVKIGSSSKLSLAEENSRTQLKVGHAMPSNLAQVENQIHRGIPSK